MRSTSQFSNLGEVRYADLAKRPFPEFRSRHGEEPLAGFRASSLPREISTALGM
jgi:hypothetical protein